MKTLRTLALTTVALAACAASVPAQTKADQLKAVLQQMNVSSAAFKNAQADVQYDIYTRAVRDDSLENGSIYVERSGNSYEMGAISYLPGPDGKPTAKVHQIISYAPPTFQMDTVDASGTHQVDVFNAGANQAKYEGFLTLGFGGSGDALAAAWAITYVGPETVDGVATEQLDLVPKDPSVKSTFTHVTIWIDPRRDISMKQIFYAPNNDKKTATYSNIRLNTRIDKRPYTIPKSARRIVH
jgi:outer membrane lipoprotein-sorting protein